MLAEYIMAGFTVAVIVAAMLVGFIALIAMINYLFDAAFGMNFQQVLGYLFFPIAWVLGIPGGEAMQAGSIMATKLVTNEYRRCGEGAERREGQHGVALWFEAGVRLDPGELALGRRHRCDALSDGFEQGLPVTEALLSLGIPMFRGENEVKADKRRWSD